MNAVGSMSSPAASGLDRDQAVLGLHAAVLLVPQQPQHCTQQQPGLVRLDDGVDEPALGGDVRDRHVEVVDVFVR